MSVYLLLPAKDEAPNLPGLIARARAAGLEVVVCDDGSTDDTAGVARAAGATVLRHERNRGLAQALRTLLGHFLDTASPGDYAAVMDADGTMDPADVAVMLERALREECDLVIASRFRGGGARGLSPSRQLLSRLARLALTLLHPVPGVTDYTTGFRLYSYGFLRHYQREVPRFFEAQGFQAQTELLLRAAQMGARVGEVGTTIRYDLKQGRTKMRVVKTAAAYLRMALRLRTGRRPRPLPGAAHRLG